MICILNATEKNQLLCPFWFTMTKLSIMDRKKGYAAVYSQNYLLNTWESSVLPIILSNKLLGSSNSTKEREVYKNFFGSTLQTRSTKKIHTPTCEATVNNNIESQGYLYIEEFLDPKSCDVIIQQFKNASSNKLPKSNIGLNDSTDQFNEVYNSSRSPLRYCYVQANESQKINYYGIEKLSEITTFDWSGNINDVCFPVFEYHENGYIEAHRGRNVGFGANDYVAVLMLTNYGSDFLGGEFYLNKEAKASDDGKTIYDENTNSRVYFKQGKGSLLIFNNRIHVHGTTPVKKSESGSTVRMTTSWRMTE